MIVSNKARGDGAAGPVPSLADAAADGPAAVPPAAPLPPSAGTRLLFRYVLAQRGLLAGTVAFAVAAATLEGAGVSLLIPLLGSIEPGSEPMRSGVAWVDRYVLATGASPTARLVWISALVVALIAVRSALGVMAQRRALRLRETVLDRLRNDLFGQLTRLPLRYYERTDGSTLVNTFTTELGRAGYLMITVSLVLTEAVKAVAYLALALLISWQLTLVGRRRAGGPVLDPPRPHRPGPRAGRPDHDGQRPRGGHRRRVYRGRRDGALARRGGVRARAAPTGERRRPRPRRPDGGPGHDRQAHRRGGGGARDDLARGRERAPVRPDGGALDARAAGVPVRADAHLAGRPAAQQLAQPHRDQRRGAAPADRGGAPRRRQAVAGRRARAVRPAGARRPVRGRLVLVRARRPGRPRRHLRDPPGPDRRPGRRLRRRQVDARPPAPALLRPRLRPRPAGRPRPPRPPPGQRAPPAGGREPGHVPVQRHRRRQPGLRARPPGLGRRAAPGRPSGQRPGLSSRPCPSPGTPSWATAASGSPAASASGWRLRGPSSATPTSSSWTRPRARSTASRSSPSSRP